MKTFDFGTFRIAVREMGFSGEEPVWRVSLEGRGIPAVTVNNVGAGPEETVALSFLGELRSVLLAGASKYASRAILRGEDPREVRKAADLMHAAASAVGDAAIAAAEAAIEAGPPEEAAPPPPPEAPPGAPPGTAEWLRTVGTFMDRTYDLGTFRVRVRVLGAMEPDNVVYVSSLAAPGASYEERAVSRTFLPAEVAMGTIERLVRAAGLPTEAIVAEMAREAVVDPAQRGPGFAEARKAAALAVGVPALQSALPVLDRAADAEFEEQRAAEIQMTEERVREIDARLRELRARR